MEKTAERLGKTPAQGMRDILPEEMELRLRVLEIIRETYSAYGFLTMETPCVENLANLNCKAGGENEKLTFKILKRGEKLRIDEAKTETDLADLGLRYDLTVPLVRYYAAHQAELPSPFRALQYGNVFRADRPQRGRFRQFMQCDIDILGEESNLAETELILATANALGKLGFKRFEIRLNDRRILRAMAAFSGFDESEYDEVFIMLDKMDKLGRDGVLEELKNHGFPGDKAEKYLGLFESCAKATDPVWYITEKVKNYLDPSVRDEFKTLIDRVNSAKGDHFSLVFDPTLVRGMSYYTGTIFEVSTDEFGSSLGGGGRYDGLVEKFTGQHVPACGFSLGFERIIMLLLERGALSAGKKEKKAVLLEKGLPEERLQALLKEAEGLRKDGRQILITGMLKNKKHQKEQLAEQGFTEIEEIYCNPLKK